METQSTKSTKSKDSGASEGELDVKNISLPHPSNAGTVWPGVNSIELPEQDKQLIDIVNIREHGEPTKYSKQCGKDVHLHHLANESSGGLEMRDDDRIMPSAIKDMAKKFASKIIHGQILDLTSSPAPSYIHHYVS